MASVTRYLRMVGQDDRAGDAILYAGEVITAVLAGKEVPLPPKSLFTKSPGEKPLKL